LTTFSGSYDPVDVSFLLTPLDLPLMSVAEKEALLRSGKRHYSEVLSAEAPPSAAYLAAFQAALECNGARLAGDIKSLAAALAERPASEAGLALVSFARAGTPIGVLLLRELGYGEVERPADPDWNTQLAIFDKLGPLVARYPLADRRSDVMAARAMLRERLARIE